MESITIKSKNKGNFPETTTSYLVFLLINVGAYMEEQPR